MTATTPTVKTTSTAAPVRFISARKALAVVSRKKARTAFLAILLRALSALAV